VVALGQSLGIATVAEGLETPEHIERMKALGCSFGQGYFFAKPLRAEAVPAGLERLLRRTPKPDRAGRRRSRVQPQLGEGAA
jgi:EAL domain-containing protein (putative c-di-GMP-specific phosphodiesterase class I)